LLLAAVFESISLSAPVVFTSGGSEANNLFLKGLAACRKPGRLAVSAIEHPCVLQPARQLRRQGWQLREIAVDAQGLVAADDYAAALAEQPDVLSIMLANNETGLGARRYGSRDVGGDSWATQKTITWLQSRAYRFDDISGMHVTQTSTGRSILGHSGHSDGQQIDLRYADGQGGYTDALGGQGDGTAIQQMFNAARQEVVTNATDKPQLARLQAWIAANSALLDAVISRPIRRTLGGE